MPKVTCIIVNYRNSEDTRDVLQSLASIKGQEWLDIIVIDNGSTDITAAKLRRDPPLPFKLILNAENIGFAAAVNLGIAQSAPSDYFWLLNNDVLLEPECLVSLIEAAENNSAGIVGSLVFYYPEKDKIWAAGGKIHYPWFIVQHIGKGCSGKTYSLPSGPIPASFINGCSQLIRSDLMARLGRLDESLFLYGEDVDLCLRAQALGGSLYLQPRSIVWHKASQASGGEFNPLREYYLTRNGYEMIRRHVPSSMGRLFAYGSRLPWDLWRTGRSCVKCGIPAYKAWGIVWAALCDFKNRRLGKGRQHKA
jgi:GT2 family glycosyltransferase